MTHQTEAELELELIDQLQGLGFDKIQLGPALTLDDNLKKQLEAFNQTTFSDAEFERILNHLSKGSSFDKAHTLRDRFLLKRDDESDLYVLFFNIESWCQNLYQVTHQVEQEGKYQNRYDVTLLINGLPLVHIELKKRGCELKKAFNQVNRYHRHSFVGTLFDYVQIFVISNGVNTKYFANNPRQSYEQTFFWTDEHNQKLSKLVDFAQVFLEKCFVSQMIAEGIVLNQTMKIPMVMRPYQFYAVRAIEKRVQESDKNGYIWHTTGSGKTLTSFKVSQNLCNLPDIAKVLFVVDRKDLDIQTIKEFKAFKKDCVESTDKTQSLVDQLKDPNRKLTVTTIQKLDRAIKNERFKSQFEYLQDQKIIIIFDECHRSQFGKTHAKIKSFFSQAQMFGFTGTPIFADNHVEGTTTADVFDECLHRYIITHAISDENVLGFAVEYVGKYKKKEADTIDGDFQAEDTSDDWVKGIHKKEVFESDERIEKIAKYMVQDWQKKTKKGTFNALCAVSSIDALKKYYTYLKESKPDDMSIATVFTFDPNEERDWMDADIYGDQEYPDVQFSRDFLEVCISDYNLEFGTNFSTATFDLYYKDVQDKIKKKQIDLTLVVNMLLTGFDAPRLNTLYVDKNLRYHGLIQAYSRTNRLLDRNKPHGNIVSFRNLKKNTDDALKLFGDENAKEIVFKKPYEQLKSEFEAMLANLTQAYPDPSSVDEIQSEKEKEAFIKTFRELLRLKASIETYEGFSLEDVGIQEQVFMDFQSKYLDLYEQQKKSVDDPESIIDEIDFEIELIARDKINYDYIMSLIGHLRDITSEEVRETKTQEILKMLDQGGVQLRKKKDLIEKFIKEQLPKVSQDMEMADAFEIFISQEKYKAIESIADQQKLDPKKLQEIIRDYLYRQRMPMSSKLLALCNTQPPFLEQDEVIQKIKQSILDFVEKYEWEA